MAGSFASSLNLAAKSTSAGFEAILSSRNVQKRMSDERKRARFVHKGRLARKRWEKRIRAKRNRVGGRSAEQLTEQCAQLAPPLRLAARAYRGSADGGDAVIAVIPVNGSILSSEYSPYPQ